MHPQIFTSFDVSTASSHSWLNTQVAFAVRCQGSVAEFLYPHLGSLLLGRRGLSRIFNRWRIGKNYCFFHLRQAHLDVSRIKHILPCIILGFLGGYLFNCGLHLDQSCTFRLHFSGIIVRQLKLIQHDGLCFEERALFELVGKLSWR